MLLGSVETEPPWDWRCVELDQGLCDSVNLGYCEVVRSQMAVGGDGEHRGGEGLGGVGRSLQRIGAEWEAGLDGLGITGWSIQS